MTLFENAKKVAEFHLSQSNWDDRSYTPDQDQVKQLQKSIFAKWIVKGAKVDKRGGRVVILKRRTIRNLP